MGRKTVRAEKSAQRAAAEAASKAAVRAPLPKREKRAEVFCLIGGILLLFVMCLDIDTPLKVTALALLLSGAAVMLWKRKVIARRFGTVAAMLTAYCVMLSLSAVYAPSGKFALGEILKNLLALALFLLALGLEPEHGERSGRCCATCVERASALASILSIDFAGPKLLSGPLLRLLSPVSLIFRADSGVDGSRLGTIIGNVNVFSGAAGLGVLVGLALLAATEDKRERRWHLVCLAVNATAFVCALSRGAMAGIAAAFLAYLFFERGEARARALVVMVETLLFAGAAAVVGVLTRYGSIRGFRFALLASTVICAVGLVAVDETVGRKATERLKDHANAVMTAVFALLGAVAIFAVAALNLTGPMSIQTGDFIMRAIHPAAGECVLHAEAEGNVELSVNYLPHADAYAGDEVSLYRGTVEDALDGATFTVPEDTGVVLLYFRTDAGAVISDLRYEGASSGRVKLDYLLIPESISSFLEGMFYGNSFLLRQMQWATAIRLWKESPIIGLGVGSFESRGIGAMPFYYETKYVHCHYLQTLLDMGVIGLALFLGLLAACAFVLVRAGKKETMNPMVPALGACLVFLSLQAATDVIFSSGFYLPAVFLVFALMSICAGDTLPVKLGEGAKKWFPRSTLALLAVWIVLLSLNLYARALFKNPTYDDLVTAEKIDRFERQDYMISYASAAVKLENRPEEITQRMYAYLKELEDAGTDSVHYYAAECYFELGETEKALEQLARYTNCAPNIRSSWNAAFTLASQYDNGQKEYVDGVETLWRNLQARNETAAVPVTLDGAVLDWLLLSAQKYNYNIEYN